MILYRKDDFVYFDYNNQKAWLHSQKVDFAVLGPTSIRVNAELNTSSKLVFEGECINILDSSGIPYGTTPEQVVLGFNKGFDTNWTDQITRPISIKFNQIQNSTTTAVDLNVGDRTITLADPTGFIIESYCILFNPALETFTICTVVAVAGNVITIDAPMDKPYPAGTFIDSSIVNMNVDGSVTPQIFGLRGLGAPPGVDLDVDITRVITVMLTTDPPAYDQFGDQPALLNGVQLRVRNGEYTNSNNFKTNSGFAAVAYDFSAADTVNPSQGQNGWICRQTFAGPSKHGVVIRLPVGSDIECIIQDDLTGIEVFTITAQGHITNTLP